MAVTTTLGKFVRAQRQLLNMTQDDLAEAIDRDQTYVSQLERGRVKSLPHPDFLLVLAKALKTTREDILRSLGYLNGENTGEYDGGDEGIFLEMYRRVDELSVPEHLKNVLRKDISFIRERWELDQVDAKAEPRALESGIPARP